MLAIMISVFLISMMFGMPIAFAMSLSSTTAFLVDGSATLQLVGQQVYNSTSNYSLIAVPFFMLAGSVMNMGGVSRRLINFCRMLLGWMPGGLGIVAIFAAMIFAAISGSGPATVAALGVFMIPSMVEDGYDIGFSGALMSSAGGLGIIIPPSIPMVVYATLSGVSVGTMFMAGFMPGILLGVAMMIYTFFFAKKKGYKPAPAKRDPGVKGVVKITLQAIPALLMPVIILGGIYGGIFTATEASGIAVVYGLILGIFVYKEIKLKDMKKLLLDAGIMSAASMLIISLADGFNWIISINRVPAALSGFVLSVFGSPTMLLLALIVLFLILGCFMSVNAAMIVLTPIMVPVMNSMGVSLVTFGIIMVICISLGMVTPPFGVNLFVAAGIAKVPFDRMSRQAFVFVGICTVVLLLMMLIPELILFLPRIMGFTV